MSHNWQCLSSGVRDRRRHTAVLGMHLCGALSIQAIGAFEEIEAIDAIVLCPCCLPSKSAAGSDPAWYASKKQDDQYAAWVKHLVAQVGTSAGRTVECTIAEELDDGTAVSSHTHNHANDAAAAKNSVIVTTKLTKAKRPKLNLTIEE